MSGNLTRSEIDRAGYYGAFRRDPKKTQASNWPDFVRLFIDNDSLAKIVRKIKEIDKDRNGNVTNQELEDIVTLCHPQLKETGLIDLFKPFADPINNILVNYK